MTILKIVGFADAVLSAGSFALMIRIEQTFLHRLLPPRASNLQIRLTDKHRYAWFLQVDSTICQNVPLQFCHDSPSKIEGKP